MSAVNVRVEGQLQTMASQSAFIVERQLLVKADVTASLRDWLVHIESCRPSRTLSNVRFLS